MELRLNYNGALVVINKDFFELESQLTSFHGCGIYVTYTESTGDVQTRYIVLVEDDTYAKYTYILLEYINAIFQEFKDSICYAKTHTVCIDADYLSADLKAIFSKVIKEYDSIIGTEMLDMQNKAEYACTTALSKYYTEITTTIAEHIDYPNQA